MAACLPTSLTLIWGTWCAHHRLQLKYTNLGQLGQVVNHYRHVHQGLLVRLTVHVVPLYSQGR